VRRESAGADYTTVAGLELMQLGRVPDRTGDQVTVDGWRVEVLEVAHHAITRVRFTPAAAAAEDGAEETTAG
jgi:putative hemolysin